MSAFHVNPKTGKAGQCRAARGACPFGSPEDHFATKAEAQAAAEAMLAREHGVVPGVRLPRVRVRDYYVDEAGLDEVFSKMNDAKFFVNELQRSMQWDELVSKPGEHWYSNGVVEFKIFHHRDHQGRVAYEVRNTRNIVHPMLDPIFLRPQD